MIPDILEPKTSALIDDLTPLPDVPHNLIRAHGLQDIYDELEKHRLLSHEQAYRMRRRFDDYDSAAWLVVAPDGRVFYHGWAIVRPSRWTRSGNDAATWMPTMAQTRMVRCGRHCSGSRRYSRSGKPENWSPCSTRTGTCPSAPTAVRVHTH